MCLKKIKRFAIKQKYSIVGFLIKRNVSLQEKSDILRREKMRWFYGF